MANDPVTERVVGYAIASRAHSHREMIVSQSALRKSFG